MQVLSILTVDRFLIRRYIITNMHLFTSHYLRKQKSLLKYLLVIIVLFSVFSECHRFAHALQSEQQCQLCLSSFDFEHALPVNVTFFDIERKTYTPIELRYWPFYSLFKAQFGNRDPPLFL
jgi:hypothetical protein